MKKRRVLGSQRGFTLVELGIVMAIIAILAAVAYPTYTGMRKRAYVAEAKAIVQEIRIDKWAEFVEAGKDDWAGFTPSALGIKYDTTVWKFSGSVPTGGATYDIKAEPQENAPAGLGTTDSFTWKLTTTGGVTQ